MPGVGRHALQQAAHRTLGTLDLLTEPMGTADQESVDTPLGVVARRLSGDLREGVRGSVLANGENMAAT